MVKNMICKVALVPLQENQDRMLDQEKGHSQEQDSQAASCWRCLTSAPPLPASARHVSLWWAHRSLLTILSAVGQAEREVQTDKALSLYRKQAFCADLLRLQNWKFCCRALRRKSELPSLSGDEGRRDGRQEEGNRSRRVSKVSQAGEPCQILRAQRDGETHSTWCTFSFPAINIPLTAAPARLTKCACQRVYIICN